MRRIFSPSILPYLAVILSLCLVWLLLLQLENPVSLDDGLRHFAMARLMTEQGIGTAEWSQFFSHGYFAHHSVDPWFLSNLAFIPLLSFGPVLALKLFALCSVFLLLISFLYACSVFRASPLVTAVGIGLLLFFDPSFFYRLLVARPYELVTPFAVIIIAAAISKRSFLIGIALTLCVLLSQIFIFPLLIALLAVAWRISLRDWREAGTLLFWISFGVLIGFWLHPDSLEYVLYMHDTFLRIPLLPGVRLGVEMQSGFVLGSRVVVVLGILTLLHVVLLKEGMTYRKYLQSGLFFLAALTGLFTVLFFFWARSIDFLWPILILLLVLSLSVSPGIFSRTIAAMLPRKFCPSLRIRVFVLFLLLSSVFLAMAYTLTATDADRSLEVYAQALQNIPADSSMLTVDWHFFMPAVLVRPDLKYATGIDPSYTYLDNPRVLELLASLGTPKFKSSPTESDLREWLQNILALYPSDYLVLFRSKHAAVIDQFEKSGMKDLSRSAEVAVFAKET